MKSRQEIKALAKEAVAKQRGSAVLIIFSILVFAFVMSLLNYVFRLVPGLGGLLSLALSCALLVWAVNMYGAFIKIFKGEETGLKEVASNMKVNFLRKLGGSWWMALWVSLWSLLFVIPGIIKFLAYYFTPNILADCPNVKATDALKLSMRITQGPRRKYLSLF